MKEEELLGIRREFEKRIAANRKHDWRVSIGRYEAWDHSIRSYMWITETSQQLCAISALLCESRKSDFYTSKRVVDIYIYIYLQYSISTI